MVRQFYETQMNLIRSELAQRIPVEYWPRRVISCKEISDLLVFRDDATLREIASYLSVKISDEQEDCHGGAVAPQPVFAIDIQTKKWLEHLAV